MSLQDLGSIGDRARGDDNSYTNIPRPKQRSDRKQDINLVRQNFVEQYKTASLPRTSSSSSAGDSARRRSVGDTFPGTFNDDSDKDRESDREEGEPFSPQSSGHYIQMNPREVPIDSDSSVEELGENDPTGFNPGTYVPFQPSSSRSPDVYVEMNRVRGSDERSRNTSVRSSDSYQSPEEGQQTPEVSSYVNMKPGSMTSSTSSEDPPGDERFDHLNREETATLSDNYVNIGPQNAGKLKKSRSQVQHGSTGAYVNVDVTRSKSMDGKPPRFRIVSEETRPTPTTSVDEIGEQARGYVNVRADVPNSKTDGNYANFVPQNSTQSAGVSPGKAKQELHYASVDFSGEAGSSPNRRPRGSSREENYSKIDFEKSLVLADICITRERQLHHA